jgi:hypothetical protein
MDTRGRGIRRIHRRERHERIDRSIDSRPTMRAIATDASSSKSGVLAPRRGPTGGVGAREAHANGGGDGAREVVTPNFRWVLVLRARRRRIDRSIDRCERARVRACVGA